MKLLYLCLTFSVIFTLIFSFAFFISETISYGIQENNLFETNDEIVLNDVIIELKFGKVKGFAINESGFHYNQFLGVPYAKPPIDELRFQRPEPPDKWSDVLTADRWPSFCMQVNLDQYRYLTPIMTFNTSEDCLYLNIWSPSTVGSDSPKPVIVYIHGGVFVYMGISFDIFNAGVVSSLGDVLFVTVNYRLGVFGFLDDEEEEESDNLVKNVGVYDQIMALNWVKDNIGAFGGDPHKVTLMGQSAGAIAIGLLMASPVASHLFQRAILESASPMQMRFFFEVSKSNYKRVLQSTDCVKVGHKRQIQCLRALSGRQLNAVHAVLMNDTFLSFSPTIPTLVLPQFPREAFNPDMADHEIQQTEVLLGGNQDEGTLFLHQILPELFPLERLPDINRTEVHRLLYEFSKSYHNLTAIQLQNLLESTLGITGETPEEIRQQLSTVMGDLMFKCPVIKFAESLAEWPNTTVYMYYFTERSGHLPEWIGSSHWEEVQFVFGLPLRYPDRYSAKQRVFTERLIKTWTHFATTGQMLAQLGRVWPKYSSESGVHLELNSERSSVGQRLEQNYYSMFEMVFETI